jgi:hypothetical protein
MRPTAPTCSSRAGTRSLKQLSAQSAGSLDGTERHRALLQVAQPSELIQTVSRFVLEYSQEYMKKFEEMVKQHLPLPLTAPDTLAAMYEDNMKQVRVWVPQHVIHTLRIGFHA